MKVTIKNFNVDWKLIKNACRQTVNLGDSEKEPSSEWKRKLLIARHSPLRLGKILFKFEDIPYYVHTHIVRHNVGVIPFVGTSREDRTGIKREERKQTDLISMMIEVNLEALMNISNKRLCYQASKETRELWELVVLEVAKYDPDIAWACVPNGIYLGGCPEKFGKCNKCNQQLMAMTPFEYISIDRRYDAYHEMEAAKTLVKRRT